MVSTLAHSNVVSSTIPRSSASVISEKQDRKQPGSYANYNMTLNYYLALISPSSHLVLSPPAKSIFGVFIGLDYRELGFL